MGVMRPLDWAGLDRSTRNALLERGLNEIFDPALRESIGSLIEDVRDRGDDAVCDALARFDGIEIEPDQLRISAEELEAANVSADVDSAIDDAIDHLRAFNEQQMSRLVDWSFESEPGLMVGEQFSPVASVGLFTPSGKASYPSVAYQLAVPATVAGVPELTLVVPPIPGSDGAVDPAVLVVCRKLGLERVFRVNGPAGIAALGFGTERIPSVEMVVGPGSPAVTLAQVEMQRYGVSTMMLLGPTESMVVADTSADPARLAADLLIEAEHGTDSTVVLITDAPALAAATDLELDRQLADLPEQRATAAKASLGLNGGCILVEDLAIASQIVNAFAPEHLQLAVGDDRVDQFLAEIEHAGEILIGQHTPFSAANFIIGCPASLPTSGFARVSSGITAATFTKRTAIAKADHQALKRMAPSVIALADHEGFSAHGAAIRHRFDR